MNSALYEDKSELSVLILSVFLHMLPYVNSLLDQVVKVFGNFRGKSVLLQNSKNLAASDTLNLGDAVVVSEDDTDLGRRTSLFGQLDDLFDQVGGINLDPAGRGLSVRKTSSGNTFAI